MTDAHTHRDCYNFAPIDVSKGVCHLTKDVVLADTEACADFHRIPKCKNCKEFSCEVGSVEMGVCGISTHEPRFFAYPDMVAVTCGHYKAD